MQIDLTNNEIYILKMILKTEIIETNDLIEKTDSKDKEELQKYLIDIKTIQDKLE